MLILHRVRVDLADPLLGPLGLLRAISDLLIPLNLVVFLCGVDLAPDLTNANPYLLVQLINLLLNGVTLIDPE